MPTDPAQVSSSQTTLLVIACVLIVGCIGGMVLAAIKPSKPCPPRPSPGSPEAIAQLSEQAARALIAMERRQRFSFGRVLALLAVILIIMGGFSCVL